MNEKLIFTTNSFRAERSSVLPSGVYSREFSAMLLAAVICAGAYMLMPLVVDISGVFLVIILLVVYVIVFLGARTYVFHERSLKAVFDKKTGLLEVFTTNLLIKKRKKYPLDTILSLEVGSRTFIPDNIDGIKFVEKISAQHGSYVPGLGETEEFVTITITFKDGRERVIFAGRIDDEPEIPLNEIKTFLGIQT